VTSQNSRDAVASPTGSPAKTCGLVMPISSIDERTEQHWLDVRSVLNDAIKDAGFEANLVSDADDIGVIQKRIVQNLYENPLVLCDVSARNPNVMFELGMRLAFDKAVIIVKGDHTPYIFDTGQIEHLEYPRDLRFTDIVKFKKNVTYKIKATYESANNDPKYVSFLKQFGSFSVPIIDSEEVSRDEFIIAELKDLKRSVNSIRRAAARPSSKTSLTRSKYGRDIGETQSKAIALTNIYEGIRRYMALHDMDNVDQLRSQINDCMEYVEHIIDAREHYDTKDEFEDNFNEVLSGFIL
jgi:heterodisulfide reductase subunit C